MRPAEILCELQALQLYDDEQWQEYLGLFEDDVLHELRQPLPVPLSSGECELARRIIGTGGGARADTGASPKITTVARLAQQPVRSGMTLGVVSGCYDLLHLGHLRCFRQARQLLEPFPDGRLCAMTLADQHIRAKKGADRPVLHLQERLAMIAAVRLIDYVVPLAEPDCLAAFEQLRPDLLCKPELDLSQTIVRAEVELVRKLGGRIEITGPKSFSTTSFIDKIRRHHQTNSVRENYP
jgi:cytidyltransferase-like protein